MNGIIIVIKFGIKKKDKNTISKISICNKFVNVNNLVSCNNHVMLKKIKKIREQDFISCIKIYKLILLSIISC